MKTKQTNQAFVDLAETLVPQLYKEKVYPTALIDVVSDPEAFQGWRTERVGAIVELADRVLGKGDSVILDFGDHQVGYLTLSINNVNSNADAPLRLKLIFGEMPCEIGEDFDDYDGWLSRSWLQDETIVIDVLPGTVTLPRRYTFRYLKMIVLATSKRYSVSFPEIYCTTVTSGDVAQVKPLPGHLSEELKEMDRIGIKTLQDCMHTVFEDGPKRDRRLWIGDLRLQALVNYETFNSNDLVKRCLYLFGGMLLEEGQVGACLYEKPAPFVDDIYLYDYSLFFVATVYDYYIATQDRVVLEELWPIALNQLHIGLKRLDERGIVTDDDTWYCFLDWHDDLNKQAGAQAVLIYCLKRGLALAEELGDEEAGSMISEAIHHATDAAMTHLWDHKQGYFTSGANAQVSWASQIWMVLAEVLDEDQNGALLDRLFEQPPAIAMSTPYLYHHLIEALLLCGKKEKALAEMRAYWGEMINDGADTFWELYNPSDKKLSPYGSNLVNSYCHAWSCTPTYFIRKYFTGENN
ncbi:family 78 glycoside hydrolase catalytic domain [Paenibacillus luteus]|uniref:alpha-L-rhamnosidase-related protein n=1 Tax=Paenibacillus luteus TaxID=2545753 RepID=UPI001143028E|nr:family 78 glycoside hydrolase catalytic domain [Paenibacillus luteus]